MRFKPGAIITAIVAFVATGGIVTAFLVSSSPYVTIAEARQMPAKKVNIIGDIQKETIVNDPIQGTITFNMVDPHKDKITVIYSGPTPANMGDATRVVAIGMVKEGKLYAKDLRIKCPSKYETQSSTGS